MNYNTNILYNNYTSKNPSRRAYQTQPYNFYQSPSSKASNNNTINPYQNKNQNFSSTNRSKYYQNQNMLSPHYKNTLKWRNIMKINVEQLRNSGDINLIQSNLDNLVFADITEEDIQNIPDTNIAKLIEILQTMAEILLNEREEVEGEINQLEKENIKIMEEFRSKAKNEIKSKDLLRRLKKEKKRDLGVINSYINVINNLKNGNFYNLRQINANITDINIKNKNAENINLSSNRRGEFKCEHCPDKNFMTEYELHKHLSEVHGINKLGQSQNMQQNQILQPQINIQLPPDYYNNGNNNNFNNNEELMKKMDDMKREFQETYNKLNEEKNREQQNMNINNNRNEFFQ